MKRVVWIGDSLGRLREFPAEARREAGYQLERLQAAFQKKSRKTARTDTDLARRRFAELVRERRQQ